MRASFVRDILKMGQNIEADLLGHGNQLKYFPQIAFDYLQKINCEIEIEKLLEFVLSNDFPLQLDPENLFGQPPITIFRSSHFVVDIYFWSDLDTLAHSHAFRGSFRLLSGRTIQAEYEIKQGNFQTEELFISEIESQNIRLLSPGDCVLVEPGLEFIHETIHCDKPTLTLMVRTINEDMFQHIYMRPNFFYKQDEKLSVTERKYLALLQQPNLSTEKNHEAFFHSLSSTKLLHLYYSKLIDETHPLWSSFHNGIDTRAWARDFRRADVIESNLRISNTKLSSDEALVNALLHLNCSIEEMISLTGFSAEKIKRVSMKIVAKEGTSLRLNDSALKVLESKLNGDSLAEIVRNMAQEFDVSLEILNKDVYDTLGQIQKTKILEKVC